MATKRRDPVPQGHYEARIVRSQFVGDRLDLDVEIIGGPHDGRVITRKLYLHSPDANTKRRDISDLERICRAVGVLAPKDSSDLHDIPMVVHIGVTGRRNTLLAYSRKPRPISPAAAPPAAAAGLAGPSIVRLSDVEPEQVRWLWPSRIATGKLTLVAGDPGLGKSFLTLDIAARVSTGVGWPDAPNVPFEPGDVVLLSAEDDVADTIRPRLDAAGADVARIVAINAVRAPDKQGKVSARPVDLSQDVEYVEAAIGQLAKPKLVVVDPISAYMGETDSHNNAETRARLAKLADLAVRRQVAVVCVSHLNKGAGRSAVYRVTGSLGFVAAARTVWSVSRDEHDHERRLMLPIKNNLARDTDGLAYSLYAPEGIATPRVAWEDETVAMIADDVLNAGDDERSKTAVEQAAEWLRETLAARPVTPADVITRAQEAGYSESTVQRAKRRAGVESIAQRDDDNKMTGWAWRLRQPDGQVVS
ncbi:MAG: AAA family ATPase [Planctomycetes bacterium]|nr:AAA family ATPase [Planctomycetota bacterium]